MVLSIFMIMQHVDTRLQRRRRAMDLTERRERRISLICLLIGLLCIILSGAAFLVRWFTESPPILP